MDILLSILALVCGILGLLGAVLPILPGPPLSYVGLFLVKLAYKEAFTKEFLIIWAAITVIVTVLDYVVPSWLAAKIGSSKSAARYSLAGMIVGMVFFPPVGIIMGMLIGAFVGQLSENGRDYTKAFKASFYSFLGFLLGTGLKLLVSAIMMFYIVKEIF